MIEAEFPLATKKNPKIEKSSCTKLTVANAFPLSCCPEAQELSKGEPDVGNKVSVVSQLFSELFVTVTVVFL